MPVNKVGDLPVYELFWYHPKAIANIIGLSKVADNDNYWVRYDSQESKDFILTRTKDNKETTFHKSPHGLHWLDMKSTNAGEVVDVIINNVENNKCVYTRRSYLRAKLARKIQRIIG